MINKKVFWTLMILLIISLLSVIVFARPPYSKCCSNSNDCIYSFTCVTSGSTSYNVDGDGDNDYCKDGYWWDCNTDSQCPGNKWCSGSGGSPKYDCKNDFGLCASCSRSAQCASGTTCISGKCRIAASESGLCDNDKDDDCDGKKNYEDSDCCSVEGGYCSGDFMCCGAMPCDGPGTNKCGCPTGFDWWGPPDNECRFSEFDCTAPPSNCNTVPYQTSCIRYSFPNPFAPTQACCVFGSYGGTTYYDWDTAHITTY